MQAKTLRGLVSVSALSLVLGAGAAWAQSKMETPKHGGALEISTVYATISALSFGIGKGHALRFTDADGWCNRVTPCYVTIPSPVALAAG